jgi:hypothetical protein
MDLIEIGSSSSYSSSYSSSSSRLEVQTLSMTSLYLCPYLQPYSSSSCNIDYESWKLFLIKHQWSTYFLQTTPSNNNNNNNNNNLPSSTLLPHILTQEFLCTVSNTILLAYETNTFMDPWSQFCKQLLSFASNLRIWDISYCLDILYSSSSSSSSLALNSQQMDDQLQTTFSGLVLFLGILYGIQYRRNTTKTLIIKIYGIVDKLPMLCECIQGLVITKGFTHQIEFQFQPSSNEGASKPFIPIYL